MLETFGYSEELVDQYVGRRLKYRRMFLGLTRQNLAHSIGVSVQQIHKYENASNRISSSKLYSLANLLKVPISYFFDRIDHYDTASPSHFLAEESEEYQAFKISEKEISRLVQSYIKIRSESVRKGILDLISTVSIGEMNGVESLVNGGGD